MQIYERFTETFTVDGTSYEVSGINRDWRPIDGYPLPAGSVWEVQVLEDKQLFGAGQSKNEAFEALRKCIRFYRSVSPLKDNENLNQAFRKAHQEVESKIDAWHSSDTENNLCDFLSWNIEEYARYVEDNILPTREIERHL